MTQTVLFIHCYNCTPTMAWYSEVVRRLEEDGHNVVAPQLPGREEPHADEWLAELHQLLPRDIGSLHIVGHSLGTRAALLLCEAYDLTPASMLLIGALSNVPEQHQSRKGIDTFFTKRIDTTLLADRIDTIRVLHSKDDDRVDYQEGVMLAQELGAHLETVDGYKHFLDEQGVSVILENIAANLNTKLVRH